MKNILLTTTALVMTAGVASAEVAISGYAEMGVLGGSDIETQFHNDIDVTFKLMGETDMGLSFGATIDLDEVVGSEASINNKDNLSSVFVKGSFGTLTIGDTDGAFDWAMTDIEMLTTIADDHTAHDGFNGNSGFDGFYDGQVARYDYSFGAVGVAASVELADEAIPGVNLDPALALGVKYSGSFSGGTFALGLGFATVGANAFEPLGYELTGSVDADLIGVSAKVDMENGLSVIANYSMWDADVDGSTGEDAFVGGIDVKHYGLGLGYTTGALGLSANYGKYKVDAYNGFSEEAEGFGLAANYDLGGGAKVMVGYGDTSHGSSTWSAGLGMTF